MVTKLDRLARSVRDAHQIADGEGMKNAQAKGRLRGKQPRLSAKPESLLLQLHDACEHTMYELAELFSVGRSTVYRALERAPQKAEKKAQP